MPAAQSGSAMQPQKHAAVAEAVQPAFVVLVAMQSLANLVCLSLP